MDDPDEYKDIGITPDISLMTLYPHEAEHGKEKAWVILPYESEAVDKEVLHITRPFSAVSRKSLQDLN